MPSELFFEVVQDRAGSFSAECLNASIAIRAADLEELHGNIRAAVDSAYSGRPTPSGRSIHLIVYRED